MEGVGSRLGRNSSRYGGPTAAAAVFNGRVRKWKKKWVHVSTVGSRSSLSNGRGRSNNGGSPNSLLLCRWTPLSPSPSAGDTEEVKDSGESEEPPRRRFRYTPIVVLEEREKTAAKKSTEKEEADDEDAEEAEDEEEEKEEEDEDEKKEMNMDIDMNRKQESKAATSLDLGL